MEGKNILASKVAEFATEQHSSVESILFCDNSLDIWFIMFAVYCTYFIYKEIRDAPSDEEDY